MNSRIQLGDRDFDILKALYANTVMSFEQLKRWHFPKTNIQTASNRLSRLVLGGYIAKQRVGIVIYKRIPTPINVVFTVTRHGIQELRKRDGPVYFRDQPVPLNTFSLIHDLTLNEAVAKLIKENPKLKITNSKLMRFDPQTNAQIPDAVGVMIDGNEQMAIELELTAKSEKRYREIISNYRLLRRYSKVLILYGDETIWSKIRSTLPVDRSETANGKTIFSKFELRNLKSLLPDPIAKGDLNFGETGSQNVSIQSHENLSPRVITQIENGESQKVS
jgi:hypothetical protein